MDLDETIGPYLVIVEATLNRQLYQDLSNVFSLLYALVEHCFSFVESTQRLGSHFPNDGDASCIN